MEWILCKNEEERFDKVRENYNGNLPKRILNITALKYFGLSKELKPNRTLDYGASGISVETKWLTKYTEDLIKKELAKWEKEKNQFHLAWIKHLEDEFEKIKDIDDEKVMIVAYEI